MNASSDCLDIIKQFETFRSEPYLCPAGIPSIGYGTTRYPDDWKVTMDDPPCDIAEALYYLQHDLNNIETYVTKKVTIPLNQHQFDALCSFTYNVGVGNFGISTLLKKLNRGEYCADEFDRWIKVKGKDMPGLIKRRKAERDLFEKKSP